MPTPSTASDVAILCLPDEPAAPGGVGGEPGGAYYRRQFGASHHVIAHGFPEMSAGGLTIAQAKGQQPRPLPHGRHRLVAPSRLVPADHPMVVHAGHSGGGCVSVRL